MNGVTGRDACTALSVILTDSDPIAWACERASYLWTCEPYVDEILVLHRLKKIIPSTPARSQCCCSANRRNIRGKVRNTSPY